MVDDLNDYTEFLKRVHKSKLQILKNLLIWSIFLKAYTNDPMCGPSRASMISGVYPHNSSNFWQESCKKKYYKYKNLLKNLKRMDIMSLEVENFYIKTKVNYGVNLDTRLIMDLFLIREKKS